MVMASQSERRRDKRISFVKNVEIVGVGTRRCVDLSVGGIYLETMASFPIGTILNLRFKLQETDDHPLLVQVEVLYEHIGIGVGTGFVNLSPEDRGKIQKLVDQN
jgi:hypothetical protein